MSENFKHIKTCDSCGTELEFPKGGWFIDSPPDNGWITVFPSLNSDQRRRDFCPKSQCLTAAVNYVKELTDAAPK